MALDPALLARALRTPPDRDVTSAPYVRSVALAEAAHAAELVPFLAGGAVEAGNAGAVLCAFGPDAVPHLVQALGEQPARVREQGVDVLWAILHGEPRAVVQDALRAAAAGLDVLLDDRDPLPDERPEHVERDFRGRVCDLVYLVVRILREPQWDESVFVAADAAGRDAAIRVLRARRLTS